MILRPDRYYNTRDMATPPPSADCLIIVKCHDNECYDLYIVELRNIKKTKGFSIRNIEQKFKTVIDDFMSKRYSYIFMSEDHCINDLKMYFVSDACRIRKRFPNITESEYRKKIENTKLDALQLLKPMRFRNKVAHIDPRLPNPLVKPC